MRPLHLLGNVQARVQDQLVHMPHLVGEARLAVAALLRGAELVLEEGVVLGADNGEVVAHLAAVLRIGKPPAFDMRRAARSKYARELGWIGELW